MRTSRMRISSDPAEVPPASRGRLPLARADDPAGDLGRRDAILQAAALAAGEFLRAPVPETVVPRVLQRLGEAAAAGRVYVVEVRWVRARRQSSLRYEWVADGVRSRMDDPSLRNVPLGGIGLDRWESLLSVGEPLAGLVTELPVLEGRLLADQGIRSVAAAPLFVEGEWWGFVGFEDYEQGRAWEAGSRAALRVAAEALGGMFARLELEERAHVLVDAAEEGVLIHDSWRVLDASPSLLHMLGYGPADVLGRDPFALVAPESRAAARAHARWAHPDPYEVRLLRSDGTSLPAELRGGTVRYRSRTVRIVTVRDLSVQKAADEARRVLLQEHAARQAAEAAERRAQFLAEASRILNSSLDHHTPLARLARLAVPFLGDYCIIDVVSDGGLRRMATAHADVEREHLVQALEAFAPGGSADPIVRAYESGSTVVAGPAELHPDALATEPEHRAILHELAPQAGLFAPMQGPDGVLGVVSFVSCDPARSYAPDELAFAEDLAHRAALALANAKQFHAAQEATRERDEILAVVAHDLRNPLSTVMAASAMLLELNADPAVRKFQAMIQRSAEQMNQLIQDLLDVTRIERGRLTLELAPVGATALVEEAGAMLRPLADGRQILLELAPGPRETRVLADGSRVLQVFSNLVGNAIKFTPEGGAVRIDWRLQQEAVCFSVTDTGPGIPPEQLPHLFGRFWQARSVDRRGLGLGLSIAKAIVEAHGGAIWAESRVGVGSSFRFTLPLVRPDSPRDRRD